MEIDLSQVWAKTEPFQSILTHSVLSGVVAQVLLQKMIVPGVKKQLCAALSCTEDRLTDWIGYLASLHDIGKVEGRFQSGWAFMKERMAQAGMTPDFFDLEPVRHEKTTCQCLRGRIWRGVENRRSAQFYADILGSHHQGKTGTAGERENRTWNALQDELEYQLRVHFLHSELLLIPPVEKCDRGVVGALLLGIVILSDWIASSDFFSQAETWFHKPGAQAHAKQLAEQFLTISGLAAQPEHFGANFQDTWPNIPREGMRGLQAEVESLFKTTEGRISVMLIEAPMGEGKTEAGVYAALQMAQQWEKCGFYVALPTAATSNQMVGRMRSLLEMHRCSQTVRLLHSLAWLSNDTEQLPLPSFETEEERYASGWLLPVRRGLLGSYAVGTVDQAMMSVLLVKYGVLRLLGLAEKVLVIDELHSYDVYMSEILHRLLEWCKALEIPVVLLSATLPPEKKAQMLSVYTDEPIKSSYPAITAVTQSGHVLVHTVDRTEKRQTVSVSLCPILHQAEQIAAKAQDLVQDGGCLCILLNTVKQAQEVYRSLRAKDFDGELLLFHARFPAGRREQLEQRCIQLFGKEKNLRPHMAILVSTQVVEQSLDVDFDGMIAAVAPIDLLLQRVGRVFRHKHTLRPPHITVPHLDVLIPTEPGEFGADGFVYPQCLLHQTIHLLERRQEIRIPEDLPVLVAQGYDPAGAPPEELNSWLEHLMEDQVKAAAGGRCLIREPSKGYTPVVEAEEVQFDDLEHSSYLSAKTRLGEPTVRIALLPLDRFSYFRTKSHPCGDRLWLEEVNREEAHEILKASVPVRSKLLSRGSKDALWGMRLLEGVEVFPGTEDEHGALRYTQTDGSQIVVDKELGVYFEDGDCR